MPSDLPDGSCRYDESLPFAQADKPPAPPFHNSSVKSNQPYRPDLLQNTKNPAPQRPYILNTGPHYPAGPVQISTKPHFTTAEYIIQ